jgi:hypothetical protein
MQGTFTIRIKALFLLAVFAGNFFVVCRCSAAMASSALMRMNPVHAHCRCQKKTLPCKDKKDCSGMQAVKFNLLEKKAAAKIRVGPVNAVQVTRGYFISGVEGRPVQSNAFSCYLSPHAPPDRLAFYRRYLI